MDTVPIAFCEHVCDVLRKNGLSEMKKLSGKFGKCARFVCRHRACYISTVRNDAEEGVLFYKGRELNTPEEIEAFNKKLVRDVHIDLHDGMDKNVSRALVKRFPYAIFHFLLHTESTNEAWIDFVCSLKWLGQIKIGEDLDSHAASLFKQLVGRRKLSELEMEEDACKGGTLEALKVLLCQDQFEELTISTECDPWGTNIMSEILQLWAEDSKKLRGKSVVLQESCKSGVKQIKKFLLRRVKSQDINGDRAVRRLQDVLKICKKKERKFIDKEYPRCRCTFSRSSRCVYKYEEGEGDERRRIYFGFDAIGLVTHSEPIDLGLMMKKSFIVHVLFL
uniref:F-box domain-containing protein n=1 Tax=Steinernema glaseri TaxID=37863 RepID=A0A1I7ZZ24_9BILA